jgi:hypothetical protein
VTCHDVVYDIKWAASRECRVAHHLDES